MARIGSAAAAEEIRRGRNKLAATVVLGHAVKHIYNSGLQSILLAVIKDDMGLSAAQFGLLSTSGRVTSGATTMVAGYLGDRFANRSGIMLMISLGMMGVSYFLPARTITSNTASSAAESDDPIGTIGFISSAASPNVAEAIRISWLFSQFKLPLRVLISPL